MISDEEAQKLKDKIKELENENERLKEESEKLKKESDKIKRLLAFFQNPHMPSSKQLLKKKVEPKEHKKIGAPKGHKGATRKLKKSTKTDKHNLTDCPKCGGKIKKLFDKIIKIVEEIPTPQPVEITKHIFETGICENCGKIIANSDLPEEGNLDKNLLSHITLLKFEDRLPLRKVVKSLERQHNIQLSHTTILDATRRVSNSLKTPYQNVISSIKTSKFVHIDQTDIKVGTITFQLWVFVTQKSTLFIIRKAGYNNVMEEVLGKNYKGIIIGDGIETYRQYTDNIQRCWAHLLRESKKLSEEFDSAKPLHEALKKMFEKVNSVTIEDPPKKRQALYDKCVKNLRQWIELANSYKELRKFATKIENGLKHWFTRILHPYIEATNNNAERALREIIVQRKIFGSLRNQKGIEIIETIMTMLTTWKQNGQDTFSTLKSAI